MDDEVKRVKEEYDEKQKKKKEKEEKEKGKEKENDKKEDKDKSEQEKKDNEEKKTDTEKVGFIFHFNAINPSLTKHRISIHPLPQQRKSPEYLL